MYVLNYLFDFTEDPPRGSFGVDRPFANAPLGKSRNWLRLQDADPADPDPANGFDPDAANWKDLGDSVTLLLSAGARPGAICVRIMPDPTKPALPRATAQIVLAFGRPVKARKSQVASPFLAADGSVRTTFASGTFQMNTASAWFLPIGVPNVPAVSDRNITNQFEFAVGVVITRADGTVRHYGDDPDMDIGL